MYGEANIPVYWLVLPERKTLERFSNPVNGVYQETHVHAFDDAIEITWPIQIRVDLRELT